MKRFSIQISVWLLFFLGGIVAVGIVAQLHPRLEVMLFAKAGQHGHTIFRNADFVDRDDKPDLITLGSSTCYRGIDPRPFAASGLDAFNLCSSSQSCFNSRFLLEWVIVQEKAPNILLLDVYPDAWTLSGVEAARDLTINNNLAYHSTFQRMAWATGDIPSILKASYFGTKRWFVPHGTVQGVKDTYVPGGFSFSHKKALGSLPSCDRDTVSMSRKQERSFHQIRESCEEQGIELLLVNPPQLCEEVFETPKVMKGLPWIEGNDWPLAKVDTLYYDDHHLRGVGAELYSKWLAGEVLALMD
ncbi:hypothetical protein N9L83_03215 [Flavobacteriales bacterium]|nr:hypothetical protein [Flavobacteriales bacterium]